MLYVKPQSDIPVSHFRSILFPWSTGKLVCESAIRGSIKAKKQAESASQPLG